VKFPDKLLLLAISVVVFPVGLAAEETRDLVLVAGQSNAVGFDAYASDLPEDPADKEVMFWWRCGDPPPDDHDSSGGRSWHFLQPQPLGDPIPKESASGDAAGGLKRRGRLRARNRIRPGVAEERTDPSRDRESGVQRHRHGHGLESE
jgi:hypothetical protein